MKEVTVRHARKEDCERIMELIKELATYENKPDAVVVSMEHFVNAGFGPNPVWTALVATTSENDQELIVGFALYYKRYSTWKGCRLYLEDINITDSYRGKGIGKLLFEHLIQETKDLGFTGMMWQVLEWNEPAINFYKKFNADFDPEWINVHIDM
ncbi:GNAT family N-acetyltransferase [Chitinophaga pendula]|uniref:GNAT family N-acetyltransferase n=1 Tax=Chitinophaga TaxID=79328 RepID=UPI000BB08725|nr:MULTISPECIES: GNAT family N-acetyltransferase [Chitinophaga]ASZ14694.1 GNAT family N-acetyltransferase [Chitinophaga sp. MD30]UCJ07649.1 GNAT family N-acetyltransferase [Chitinophaga pendula]